MNSNPYNRQEQVRVLHDNKKRITHEKVDTAIKNLLFTKQPINFNSVGKESGVSKATLYNNKDIKEQIERFRNNQKFVSSPAQVKYEMSENNKDGLIESLKRKIRKLEEENKELKEHVKINYGKLYKEI
jgi:cell division protein FtsB